MGPELGPNQGQLSHCTMVQCWSQNKQPTQKTQPNKDLTPSHAPLFPLLFTVLFRFSMWSLIHCPIFLFIKKT